MEKYLIQDLRFDSSSVIVELSDEEVSVLSYFINWAELEENFSISRIGDISHENWHDGYSIVEED